MGIQGDDRLDMAAPTAASSVGQEGSPFAKAATMRDVAERAQVSVASVSRVLNGLGVTSDATRQRVLDAVEHLRYVPHFGARSLSTSKNDTIGVILPDLFGEFFSELIRGMDLAARAHGKHLIVSSSHDGAEDTLAAVRSMRGRVDGMIVLSPHVGAGSATGINRGWMPRQARDAKFPGLPAAQPGQRRVCGTLQPTGRVDVRFAVTQQMQSHHANSPSGSTARSNRTWLMRAPTMSVTVMFQPVIRTVSKTAGISPSRSCNISPAMVM